MENEIIEIVTIDGKVVGKTTREKAYKKGQLHQAVNMFVFNSKNQAYIQKRSAKKSSFPLHWDISASEHVKPGETPINAARRGLMEELSIKTNVKLFRKKHIQKSVFKKNGKNIIENELVRLYIAKYDGKIKIDINEVASGKFVTLSKLKSLLKTEKLTPWGIDEIKFLFKSKPELLVGTDSI